MEQSSLEVFMAASVFIAVSTVSVAAASRRLEQHDIARLHRQLLVVVDRLAIDVEFSGRAGCAAAKPLRALIHAARHSVEQPFVAGMIWPSPPRTAPSPP